MVQSEEEGVSKLEERLGEMIEEYKALFREPTELSPKRL